MKIDISYLDELVVEIKNLVKEAEEYKSAVAVSSPEEQKALDRKYLVTMCKTAGLCLGVAQEGSMLVGDINKIVSSSFGPPKDQKDDALNGLLSNFLKPQKINN